VANYNENDFFRLIDETLNNMEPTKSRLAENIIHKFKKYIDNIDQLKLENCFMKYIKNNLSRNFTHNQLVLLTQTSFCILGSDFTKIFQIILLNHLIEPQHIREFVASYLIRYYISFKFQNRRLSLKEFAHHYNKTKIKDIFAKN
jgi:hypothetical protein